MHDAISPIDGRYFEKTRALAPFFSEQALMRYRVMMEGEYLIALSLLGKTALRKFTSAEIKTIRALSASFNEDSYKKIKDIERTTNHDVKAVEYFIKAELTRTSLKDSVEWVHFAITSEDTNNIAYGLMLSDAMANAIRTPVGEGSAQPFKTANIGQTKRRVRKFQCACRRISQSGLA